MLQMPEDGEPDHQRRGSQPEQDHKDTAEQGTVAIQGSGRHQGGHKNGGNGPQQQESVAQTVGF